MTRARISVAISLVTTAAFLALALRKVDFKALVPWLMRMDWRWIPLLVFLGLWDLAMRAARWRLLLAPLAKASVAELFGLETMGLAVNNILFFRLGEFARTALAGRRLQLPFMSVFSTVIVERYLDVASLATLFSSAAWLLPGFLPEAARRAALWLPVGLWGGLAAFVLLRSAFGPGGAISGRLSSWPKVQAAVVELSAGALAMRGRLAAGIIACGFLLWSSDAVIYWVSARALGLDMIDFPRAVLVLSWAGAGAALPAVPGAFGTFEAMVKNIAMRCGASPTQAFGYAFVTHMAGYLMVTALGLFFLFKAEVAIADFISMKRE